MPITPAQIEAAQALLRSKWDDEGQCGSCGWHALLSEHYVEDDDIADALERDGFLYLFCVSRDDEDSAGHRGIRICVRA